MFLSYLVKNFFMVILRPRISFVLHKFKKKLILWSIFQDFTGSPQPGSGEALIFWPVNIKRFLVTRFLREGRRQIFDLK
jgi:hypothetical protein